MSDKLPQREPDADPYKAPHPDGPHVDDRSDGPRPSPDQDGGGEPIGKGPENADTIKQR